MKYIVVGALNFYERFFLRIVYFSRLIKYQFDINESLDY